MRRMVFQARVVHRNHFRMRRQPPRQRQRVLTRALHAQRERLQPLQQQERVEGALRRTPIAETFHAAADDKLDIPKRPADAKHVVQHHAVIARRRRRELRILAVAPVERARVHDHAAHARAVSADPFRGRLHKHMHPVPQRLANRAAGAERIVDDQREIVLLRQGCERLEIRHGEPRIADRFQVDRLGLRIDQGLEARHLHAIGKPCLDPDVFEGVFKLIVGAAVEVRGRDKIITHRSNIIDREKLRRVT